LFVGNRADENDLIASLRNRSSCSMNSRAPSPSHPTLLPFNPGFADLKLDAAFRITEAKAPSVNLVGQVLDDLGTGNAEPIRRLEALGDAPAVVDVYLGEREVFRCQVERFEGGYSLRGIEISDLVREVELSALLIEHASTGLSLLDESGHHLFGNAWYRARIGTKHETLRGIHFLETVQPEMHQLAADDHVEFFKGRPTPPQEWTTTSTEGQPVDLRIDSLLIERQGLGRFRLATFSDVTVQRGRDRRLALFDRVLQSAPLILFAIDKGGQFTLCEGKGLSTLGTKAGEWVGRSALEDWQHTDAVLHMKRALQGEEFKTSLHIPGPRYYDVWYLPIRDARGEPDGMMALALDTTSERLAELELREKLTTIEKQRERIELFDRALNTAPLVLWTCDDQGVFTLSEGKGLELIGLTPTEAVGLSGLEMYRGTPLETHLREAIAGKPSTVVAEAAPGIFFDSYYLPLADHAGRPLGAMGLAIEASHRLRAERELREKLELIERQSATIRALATPIIRVWDEILCLPVIGTVDSQRTADMMTGLLESIVAEQARYAIVDLTGVAVVDTTTADHLIKLFKAAKVLGVAGVLCGIQPAVAQTVVALGMDLGDVVTMRTLEEALKWCIADNTTRAERIRRKHGARSASRTGD
jgi:rsbT co-antagonist protein RsbR